MSTAISIDTTTIASLLGTVAALAAAHALSLRLLPRGTRGSLRALFVWHAFDAAIHAVFEGSFVWNCFCVWAPRANADADAAAQRSSYWLNDASRVYGAAYGDGAFSRLWREYAKADRRWGGSDAGVVSLELLTVFVGAPLAVVCAEGVRRGAWRSSSGGSSSSAAQGGGGGGVSGRSWFWMTVLATGELYGGWMTFAPEWLTGSPNLDTANWMHKYLYLCFFNLLWVVFPLWVLRLAYVALGNVGVGRELELELELEQERKGRDEGYKGNKAL